MVSPDPPRTTSRVSTKNKDTSKRSTAHNFPIRTSQKSLLSTLLKQQAAETATTNGADGSKLRGSNNDGFHKPQSKVHPKKQQSNFRRLTHNDTPVSDFSNSKDSNTSQYSSHSATQSSHSNHQTTAVFDADRYLEAINRSSTISPASILNNITHHNDVIIHNSHQQRMLANAIRESVSPLTALPKEIGKRIQLIEGSIPITQLGIIQSVSDHDPDVDAVFRMSKTLPIDFMCMKPAHHNNPLNTKDLHPGCFNVLLPKGAYAPYNAQSTMHTYISFW